MCHPIWIFYPHLINSPFFGIFHSIYNILPTLISLICISCPVPPHHLEWLNILQYFTQHFEYLTIILFWRLPYMIYIACHMWNIVKMKIKLSFTCWLQICGRKSGNLKHLLKFQVVILRNNALILGLSALIWMHSSCWIQMCNAICKN